MRTVISRYITIAIASMAVFSGYSLAEEAKKGGDSVPVIKLTVDKNSTSTNPNLKKGKGCEDLEEAKGEVIVDIPEAKTIPCDKANGCNDLKPARLEPYQYKNIPTVQTDGSCEGDD